MPKISKAGANLVQRAGGLLALHFLSPMCLAGVPGVGGGRQHTPPPLAIARSSLGSGSLPHLLTMHPFCAQLAFTPPAGGRLDVVIWSSPLIPQAGLDPLLPWLNLIAPAYCIVSPTGNQALEKQGHVLIQV